MLSDFTYIVIPGFTGDVARDVQALLCANGREKTLEHVKAVAGTGAEIAVKYGLDPHICEICGYLHDISAVITPVDMLRYAENNGMEIYEAERRVPS